MRMIFDGIEGNKITAFKGIDSPNHFMTFMEDDGQPVDITAHTVTLEVYTTKQRTTVTKSHAASISVATGGIATIDLQDTDLDYDPSTYFAYGKIDSGGGSIRLGTTPVELVIS